MQPKIDFEQAELVRPDNSSACLPADEVSGASLEIESTFATLLTFDYEQGRREGIDTLYKKAKENQWDADFDLEWSVGGQIERARNPDPPKNMMTSGAASSGVFGKFGPKEWESFNYAHQVWTVSQFMHTEQGAMACAAKLVQAVPWVDAKYYAATQVMDEARHMEVYARYLREKLQRTFPINAQLKSLIKDILADSRWDFTFLGMQVVIEGLALAAFGQQYHLTHDPLLKQITRYVMADEARHVAYGVLSLREAYSHLSEAELRERQEFCFECALRMRDRYLAEEVWEELGLPARECTELLLSDPVQRDFRRALFSKIVPNVKNLGLLDFGDGWLRRKFGELGVLAYEHRQDSSTEYVSMDLDHAPWSLIQYKHY